MTPRPASTRLLLGCSLIGAVLAVALQSVAAQTPAVTKPETPGIRNLARLETTVACAGAIEPERAIPEIRRMGFVSIVNLREATEPGAEVEKEGALAREAGLKYFHVPFNGARPDPKVADAFIDAITSPGAEPAFIHCGGGNRAATMWLIKRLVVDGWDQERAIAEAAALGQTNETHRKFALDYAAARAAGR